MRDWMSMQAGLRAQFFWRVRASFSVLEAVRAKMINFVEKYFQRFLSRIIFQTNIKYNSLV